MIPREPQQTNWLAIVGLLVSTMLVASASLGNDFPLIGRVVGPDGAPLRGASVEVLPRLGSWERLQHRLDGSEPEAVDRTSTGTDGDFELPAQPVGLWTLRVRAEGMIDARRHLPPTRAGGHLEELTMVAADGEVIVEVVDPEGRPVEGAQVDVALDWSGHPWAHAATFEALVTDARGRVRLPCPTAPQDSRTIYDPGQLQRVRAVARLAEGAGRWQTSTTGTLTGPGQLRLRVDRSTTSTRLTYRGQPLAGAAFLDPLGPVTHSDEDGRVLLPDLGRDWLLSLRLVTRDRVVGWKLVSIEPLEIESHPPTTWTGRVVSNTGEPVADAVVYSSWTGSEPVLARTDRQGAYAVAVPPDLFGLGVGAIGYLTTSVQIERHWRVAGAGGEIQLPQAVLTPAARVEARVVDPAGRPLHDVHVEVLVQKVQPNESRSRDSLLARSDTDGRLVLRGLTPGAVALALLKKPGFALREVTFEVPSEPSLESPLTWTMEHGIEVLGRTVDEDGLPVAGVSIELMPLPREEAPNAVRFARGLGEKRSNTSAADGSFSFSHVAAGPFRLRAETEGLLDAAVLLDLETPGPRDLGDVELKAGLTLRGTVIDDETDAGFSEIEVIARAGTRGVLARAVTDDAGEFSLKGLPDQQVSVHAGAGDGYRSSGATVRPPFSEAVELRLIRASGISGWVVDEGGQPVPEAYVKIAWTHEAGGMGSRTGPSKDGYFEYKGSSEGTVVVTASAPEHGSGRLTAKIGRGEHRELTVVLRPGVPLSGVVLAQDEVVTEAQVFVALPDGMDEDWESVPPTMLSAFSDLQTRVDVDGRFIFPSIEPSSVQLAVTAAGFEPYLSEVDLRSGGAHLTVELKPLPALRGLLLDAFGGPLVGARVYGSSGVVRAKAVSEADGTFALALSEPRFVRIHPPGGPSLRHNEPAAWLDDRFLRLVVPESTAKASATIFGLDEDGLAAAKLYAKGELDGGWESNAPGIIQPDGSGTVPGLYPGRWTVIASSGDLQRSEVVEIGTGEVQHVELNFADDVDLLLTVEIDGEPALGTIIDVEAIDGAVGRCRTDSHGQCLLSGLKLGNVQLRLRQGRSGLRHSLWLSVTGATEDRVALQTSRIAGRLIPPRASLVQLRQGELSVRTWAGEDGAFELRTAFVGEAELWTGADAADSDSSMVVDLVPGTDLTGIVLTPSDPPRED